MRKINLIFDFKILTFDLRRGFTFLLLGAILGGCATHHTASINWEGERIRLQFTPSDAGSPVLKCLSCNEVLAPLPLQVNEQGVAYIKIDESRLAIASHFRIQGSGIDTAITLKQLVPIEDEKNYHLKDKLIGRVMATKYVIIYKDTSMTEQIGALERQDEVNLFGKDDVFYYIHHPRFATPVVILRSHAIGIE